MALRTPRSRVFIRYLISASSLATNAVTYDVVFGRRAILPQDLTLSLRDNHTLQDAITAEEYAKDVSFGLHKTFQNSIT